jgi:serine-type D-Ala-D-Ala carboxypeptidase (penicillin-binding protein 5/6)
MTAHSHRSTRLLVAVAVAGASMSTACAVRIPTPLTHAAAATPGTSVTSPGAQLGFDMTVTSGHTSFWVPDVMPAGAPAMQARAGILVDMDTGEILWEHNANLELAPASTTKVLTSLVALENFSPQMDVTITPDALGQSSADTVMGLKVGETMSVLELLDGTLLPSGDDAASAIAVDTVGEARFIAAMNAQVAALGLHGSHFTNTSGLDDPALYTSAYDLAVIASFTYDRYPLFDHLVDTASIDLPATTDHPAFRLRNLDALLRDYPAAVGIKPGWTGSAGACLIGMAVRGGHRLLAVLLNGNHPARLEARLLDWGFTVEGLPPLLPPPTPSAKPSPTGRPRG